MNVVFSILDMEVHKQKKKLTRALCITKLQVVSVAFQRFWSGCPVPVLSDIINMQLQRRASSVTFSKQ